MSGDRVRYVISSRGSQLTFEARSDVHTVRGKASDLSGHILGAWNESGALSETPPAEMHIEFPVESLSTGNDMQDREMFKLIESRRFPKVAADLRKIRPSAQSDQYWASGNVTFAGRARAYEGELQLRRDGDKVVLTGELTINIRQFAIEAPRVLMFKMFPEVKITARLVATRA